MRIRLFLTSDQHAELARPEPRAEAEPNEGVDPGAAILDQDKKRKLKSQ